MAPFFKYSKIWLYIITGLVIVVISILCVYYFYFNSQIYYAVFQNINGLSKNDPVVMENVKVGSVSSTNFLNDNFDKQVVKILIRRNINIPENSFAEIIQNGSTESTSIFQINLVPSAGYLKEGDTIPVKSITIAKDSLINQPYKTEVTEKHSVSPEPKHKTKQVQNMKTNILFKVQFMMSKEEIPLQSKRLKNIDGVTFYKEKGLYKYVVGSEKSVSKASDLCTLMQKNGFKDAFVVAFEGNNRISIKEAMELLKK